MATSQDTPFKHRLFDMGGVFSTSMVRCSRTSSLPTRRTPRHSTRRSSRARVAAARRRCHKRGHHRAHGPVHASPATLAQPARVHGALAPARLHGDKRRSSGCTPRVAAARAPTRVRAFGDRRTAFPPSSYGRLGGVSAFERIMKPDPAIYLVSRALWPLIQQVASCGRQRGQRGGCRSPAWRTDSRAPGELEAISGSLALDFELVSQRSAPD